jgi:hypothetical protein
VFHDPYYKGLHILLMAAEKLLNMSSPYHH